MPRQASMSIKHLDVCHQLGQEKTQPRVTPFSCWDTHSPRETPLTNKQMVAVQDELGLVQACHVLPPPFFPCRQNIHQIEPEPMLCYVLVQGFLMNAQKHISEHGDTSDLLVTIIVCDCRRQRKNRLQVTSLPSERVFSAACSIISAQRNGLSESTVQKWQRIHFPQRKWEKQSW